MDGVVNGLPEYLIHFENVGSSSSLLSLDESESTSSWYFSGVINGFVEYVEHFENTVSENLDKWLGGRGAGLDGVKSLGDTC